uniref:TF-B3 domain-containing protein n=1 Tax=Solanum tuberosum TaxID=4113 RepID=M1AYB1_SOLTU
MSDDSGLRDQLLEKNEISDSYYHVDQQSDSMMVEEQNNDNSENDSLQTKHSKGSPVDTGTAWVYRDENGKHLFEKQLSEDDITGDHLEIPRRLAHYIQSLKLQRRVDVGEKTRKVNLVGENECYYFTGQWKDFVKENQLKANKDLVLLEISQQLGPRIGYTCDQKAIDMNNPLLLRRLSRADVKALYIKKLSERYSFSRGGTGLIEIEPVVEMKLCSQIVYRYGGRTNGVMFIELPKKDVEENLGRDLPLPAAGGEIALPLFDPVGNNSVEMKLLHTEMGDQYHLGGGWEVYAAKHGLLISDTIFLDKVTVQVGNDHDQLNTAQFSCHYEITYQRRRRGGTKDQSGPAAPANFAKDVVRVTKISESSEYEGDSSWLQYCTP